jgi:hypothetical protein
MDKIVVRAKVWETILWGIMTVVLVPLYVYFIVILAGMLFGSHDILTYLFTWASVVLLSWAVCFLTGFFMFCLYTFKNPILIIDADGILVNIFTQSFDLGPNNLSLTEFQTNVYRTRYGKRTVREVLFKFNKSYKLKLVFRLYSLAVRGFDSIIKISEDHLRIPLTYIPLSEPKLRELFIKESIQF